MAAKKVDGVFVILFDDTDQALPEIGYAAGEVLKIDAAATDTTGMAMTLAPTAGGDAVAEFTPGTFDGQTGEFRIPDSEISPHVEEGATAYINFWTGPEDNALRRAFGSLKRKVSIRRGVIVPSSGIGTWAIGSTFVVG